MVVVACCLPERTRRVPALVRFPLTTSRRHPREPVRRPEEDHSDELTAAPPCGGELLRSHHRLARFTPRSRLLSPPLRVSDKGSPTGRPSARCDPAGSNRSAGGNVARQDAQAGKDETDERGHGRGSARSLKHETEDRHNDRRQCDGSHNACSRTTSVSAELHVTGGVIGKVLHAWYVDAPSMRHQKSCPRHYHRDDPK
jgi:hypothetical protein